MHLHKVSDSHVLFTSDHHMLEEEDIYVEINWSVSICCFIKMSKGGKWEIYEKITSLAEHRDGEG